MLPVKKFAEALKTGKRVVLPPLYPAWIAGAPLTNTTGRSTLEVVDKYTQEISTGLVCGTADDVDEAFKAAAKAAPALAKVPGHVRKSVLGRYANLMAAHKPELVYALVVEVGKTTAECTVEVERAIDTITLCAEEAGKDHGEWINFDGTARGTGYSGIVRRFPRGVTSGIAPFNFPINLLAAHKIAPALAVGSPIVAKPSPKTPLSTSILGRLLAEAAGDDLPAGSWSLIPVEDSLGPMFSSHTDIATVSFTGSPGVGWAISKSVSDKKVVLELGGSAAAVVDETIAVEDMNALGKRLAVSGFGAAGQSCVSLQRLFLHESRAEAGLAGLVAAAEALNPGDPMVPGTTLGPLISPADADRVELAIAQAVSDGGVVETGGTRIGSSIITPTVISGVSAESSIMQNEIFGPVVATSTWKDWNDVVKKVNGTKYGLQSALWSDSSERQWAAFEDFEVGGVVINDVPSARMDAQPYGGVKESGVGREGVKYAMEDLTEQKIMLIRRGGI